MRAAAERAVAQANKPIVKLPTKLTLLINGKKFIEVTSGDVSFPVKLDAKTFAKP